MLLGYQGCAVTLAELRLHAGAARDGTSVATLKRMAQRYGFTLRAFKKDLHTLADVGFPCMAFINFNHMLVIEAAASDGLQVVDPGGGRRAMAWAEFDRQFSGVALRLDATAAAHRRLRQPLRHLPVLLMGRFGRIGLAVLMAGAVGFGECRLALALPFGWLITTPLLLVLAVLMWGRRTADRAVIARLRDDCAHRVDDLLFSRDASYYSYRALDQMAQCAALPQSLAATLQTILPGLADLLACLVILGILTVLSPLAALASGLCLILAVAGGLYCFLHPASAWRRMIAADGGSGLLDYALSPAPYQFSARDSDVKSAIAGQSATALRPRQDFARALSWLQGAIAAAIAAPAILALSLDGISAAALALLAGRSLLVLPELLPALHTLTRLAHLLEDLANSPAHRPQPVTPADHGGVEMHSVSFGYGAAVMIGPINLILPAGHIVGLTGASGAGKTTLAQIIAGILPATSGEVRRPNRVVLVEQRPRPFQASIADNVGCWQAGISQDDIIRYLHIAGLWDDVMARPGGLQSLVKDDARNWSGGQCRRLMLARALAQHPEVLILDEVLDGVDLDTERAILDRLRAQGLTVIVISQRRATLTACDQVWRLEGGLCHPWTPPQETANPGGGTVAVQLPVIPALNQPELDPALWGCLRAGAAHLGLILPDHPDPAPCPGGLSPLDWQARLHGLHLRPVLLSSPHWRRRGAAVLLARQGDGLPLLLTPSPLGGYLLRRPGQPHQNLNANCAADLSPDAWELHRLSDDPATSVWSIAANSAAGCGLWLGMATLAAAPSAPLWSQLATLAGLTAGTVAWIRGQTRLQDQGEAASRRATAHRVIGLNAAWLARQRPDRLSDWLNGLTDLGRNRVDLMLSILVSAIACFGLSLACQQPGLVIALGLAAMAVTAFLNRRAEKARRRLSPRTLRNRSFLLRLMQAMPSLLGKPAGHALRQRWKKLDTDQCRRDHGIAALDADTQSWRRILPLMAAALAAPQDWGLAVLSVWAGMQCGQHLARWHDLRLIRRRLMPLQAAPSDEAGPPPEIPPARLTAQRVGFAYEGKMVLDDVSLDIAAGEIVAIVGPSGAGKSTLLRLLLGLVPPQRGDILADGVPLSQMNRMAWRAHLAAVLQDEDLRFQSLQSHVRGQSGASLGRVASLLDAVGLWPAVAALPMGLSSLVDGRWLSGGQTAQVQLARSLCRTPALLVLDEALSGLDETAQERIFSVLRASGVTCILTTHQREVLRHVDRVLHLDQGRLTAEINPTFPPQPVASFSSSAAIDPFNGAAKLYRPQALARIEGPNRMDALLELLPPPLALSAAGLALLALAAWIAA